MKQAVVLIHGIGEQRPMSTLRSFVDGVLPPAPEGAEKYWSKPDPMSDLFELRRLQTSGRTKTHFYEYYWAYHVEGTKISHLIRWFFTLLLRFPRNVPKAIKTLWVCSWILTLLFILLLITGSLGFLELWLSPQPYLTPLWFLSLGIFSLLQVALVSYLGDAARYLSPHPRNIGVRQKIRSEGVALLKHLQDSGEYERIVVVGHSLGSVIAYDIITRLWIDYSTQYTFEKHRAEIVPVLKRGDNPQEGIRSILPTMGYRLKTHRSGDTVEIFRRAQQVAFHEQRAWGNPWRISDFITLGSPLAHAMLLLADDEADFEARKRQRELPTCPPKGDEKGYAYGSAQSVDLGDGIRFTPLILHHGAPFAVTRWTNIFFPAIFGIFGDVIGGPLHDVFGAGIDDIPVRGGGPIRLTPFSHTRYWKPEKVSKLRENRRIALDHLRRTLDLDGEHFMRRRKSTQSPGHSEAPDPAL